MQKLIYIEWVDSQGCTPSWYNLKEFKPEIPVHRSIGWVLYEDDISVSFCGNIADETETSHYQGGLRSLKTPLHWTIRRDASLNSTDRVKSILNVQVISVSRRI